MQHHRLGGASSGAARATTSERDHAALFGIFRPTVTRRVGFWAIGADFELRCRVDLLAAFWPKRAQPPDTHEPAAWPNRPMMANRVTARQGNRIALTFLA